MSSSRLGTLNPVDIVDLFNTDIPLRNMVGLRSEGGEQVQAVSLSNERPHTAITSVDGLEIVVSNIQSVRHSTLMDGRLVRENELTIFVANFSANLDSFDIKIRHTFGLDNVTRLDLTSSDYQVAIGALPAAYFDGVVAAATYKLITGAPKYIGRADDIVDAPHDGTEYARVDGEWKQSGTSALDLTGYATTASVETRVERADGGYEFTGAFAERLSGQSGSNDLGTFVSYNQDDVNHSRWKRFGFSTAANQANDNQYWGETDPNYDNTKGLFGGLHMPAGCTKLFDFGFNGDYSNALNPPIVDQATDSEFRYSAADGSIDFRECRVGDLALVRFDFNVKPQVANTTLEVAMIWQTRNAQDVGTFTFALTGEPIFYGTGTVGRNFLNRPLLSAYFASAEDVNARALLAIRADNPIQVAPLTTLVTIVR